MQRKRVVETEGLITTKEVCKIYSVSKATVYRWRAVMGAPYTTIKSKEFDCVRFDRIALSFWARNRGIFVHKETVVRNTLKTH